MPERVLIILDEAYFEYARTDPRYPDSMFYRHDNVITLRTFSKAYGLAGLRIGYGFAHEELIRNLMKVKLPFEPGTLAAAAAVGALGDTAFLYRTLELNVRGLRMLTDGLREMGLDVIDSWANFVTVVVSDAEQARSVNESMLREGVIIRPSPPSACLTAFGYQWGPTKRTSSVSPRCGARCTFAKVYLSRVTPSARMRLCRLVRSRPSARAALDTFQSAASSALRI